MPTKMLLPDGRQYGHPEEQEETPQDAPVRELGLGYRVSVRPLSWSPHTESKEEQEFRELADQWYRETRYLSSITRTVTHLAYQNIIGMGPAALPLILRELEERGGHWLWALNAITQKTLRQRGQPSTKRSMLGWLGVGNAACCEVPRSHALRKADFPSLRHSAYRITSDGRTTELHRLGPGQCR